MAAIVRKALPVCLFWAVAAAAQTRSELRTTLGRVATALTANDATQAMEPFSKSFRDYDKLREYFTGLTSAYSLVNEVDVIDEQHSEREQTATIQWAITFNVEGNESSSRRSAAIHLRLVPEKTKWKIVEFSPISLFDPSGASATTQ